MMNTRRARTKRFKYDSDYEVDSDHHSNASSHNDTDNSDEVRKGRIRDSNREFAKRMTILETWSDHWTAYTTREGDAYSLQEAKDKIKRNKKITCPIESCGKAFTSVGGLRYHYARCNIERSFRCKVCNPPSQLSTRGELLRHMILNHFDELPNLNDEQKVIADSYRNCENRSDRTKRDRKPGGDSEGTQSCQQLIRAFFELRKKVFDHQNFSKRPFRSWESQSYHWEFVTLELDRSRYYPPETQSVKFKTFPASEWRTLQAGDSCEIKNDKYGLAKSRMFYTGGIVTSCAWLPKSPLDRQSETRPDLIALSVDCRPMDLSHTYKDCSTNKGCIQFWSVDCSRDEKNAGESSACSLKFMIGHDYGAIFGMTWCPMGTSWQPCKNAQDVTSRVGLLAIACGDGQIRVISVPHNPTLVDVSLQTSDNVFESTPLFRVRPVAILMAPNIGLSIDCRTNACKSICWNLDDNQTLIMGGYANGNVAIFDLSNLSPIVYSYKEDTHVYQPLKSWVAHGAPVTGVAILSSYGERTSVATGSVDRLIKLWNLSDLSSCITLMRTPVTKIFWDFRYRGVVSATDNAFTSFLNRVSYRHPLTNGTYNVTVSTHRSTVWGLDHSIITSSVATSDGAGELFVLPQMLSKPVHKRERTITSTQSLFTILPRAVNDGTKLRTPDQLAIKENEVGHNQPESGNQAESDDEENLIEAEFLISDRPATNVPNKFLLPIEHRSVENYDDFKSSFGIEFIDYSGAVNSPDSKVSEACERASNPKEIFCDRPCDYPFSSIENVAWSPNPDTFSNLLSATHIGLCRIDRVKILDEIFQCHIETVGSQYKMSGDEKKDDS